MSYFGLSVTGSCFLMICLKYFWISGIECDPSCNPNSSFYVRTEAYNSVS